MLLEGADPADPKTRAAREDRAADVPRGEDRQRPAEPVAARARRAASGRRSISTPSSPTCSRCSSTSSRSGSIKVRRELVADAGAGARDRAPAAAGVPEPVPERARRDAERRLAVGRRRASTATGAVAEVADTGSGIPSEQLARIYDPFFTTKAIGRGTGLGLSITYGIVREHDGTIRCDSAVGQGTRFTLTLPLAPGGRRAQRPGAVASGCVRTRSELWPTSRNGTILVVDDEEIMREILETLLTREGYDVRAGRLRRRRARAGARAAVRRGDRRHHDAGPRRHRDARRAEAHRRGPRRHHDHGVRVGRERDLGDEGGRLRLHHQAVQERRSAGRRPQRDGAAPARAREPQRCGRTSRSGTTSSRTSSAAARGCGRCST